ncbi:thiamine pyrophosphate-requiring protein [Dehalococcoidia bacterium]|nr:thiamine pyrophosphate-requiring protein [Dehalococcoidia bacterium]
MNVTEAIAKILKSEGVEWISCFPSNPIIEAAAKEGIRPIAFRHERGAVMAADGYSRLNDRKKFGVVAIQDQAGAENAMGAISQAFADNVPILVLPRGSSLERIAVRPYFTAAITYRDIAKHVETISRPDMVGSVMRRAFHALRNGRPGPVVVEMPADVCDQEIDEDNIGYHSPKISIQIPAASDVTDAVTTLLKAEKPMIWAGMGVLLAGATQELKEFAELTEIPVYTSMPGKSAIDERHPLALGAGSSATTLAAREWLQSSDVLFAVGSSMTRTGYGQQVPSGKTIIHNVGSLEDINKDFGVHVAIPGDTKATLQALIAEVKSQLGDSGRKGKTDVVEQIARTKEGWLETWMPVLTDDKEPINPYRVIWELNQNLDLENSVVTHDAGSPRDMMMPFLTATSPHSYIGWGKSTHLGYGIPLMIGAKMAMPNRFCVNFMGDGAFGMSGLDIETASRSGAAITTIVLNNGGMATYPGFSPIARETFGVSRMYGDYAKIAEGMGATGITVTKPSDIGPALKEAQKLNAEGKTVLIDIHTRAEDKRSPAGFETITQWTRWD